MLPMKRQLKQNLVKQKQNEKRITHLVSDTFYYLISLFISTLAHKIYKICYSTREKVIKLRAETKKKH